MLQKGSVVAAKVSTNLYSQIPSSLLSSQYKVGEVQKGIKFGLLQSLNFVTGYAYVQLYAPPIYLGKRQYYAFVKLTDISESGIFSGTGSRYYVANNVNTTLNVRNSPNILGTIHAKLQRGSLIGTRIDSTVTNGYWKMNLATGGIGYVSGKYVTSIAPVSDNTDTETVDNPTTNQGKWQPMEIIRNTLIALVIGYLFNLAVKSSSKK